MVETQLSLASKIFNNSQEGMVITDRNANIIDELAFPLTFGFELMPQLFIEALVFSNRAHRFHIRSVYPQTHSLATIRNTPH